MSPIYAAALILNPRFRTRYIEQYWPRKWRAVALKAVKELWEQYREANISEPDTPAFTPFSYEDQNLGEPKEPKELDAYDRICLNRLHISRPSSGDEYEDYNLMDLCSPGKKGALTWWCQEAQRQRYPRLSLMAIDILSIPAMSDEPERVFSGGRRTISWDRGSMLPETLEQRECLKHWKKSGIVNSLIYEEIE
jgi:hAT family protein